MEMVKGELMAPGGLSGTGSLFAVNHNADPKLATLRYRLKDAQIDVAEEAFEVGRAEVQSRLLHHPQRERRATLGRQRRSSG